MRDRILWGFVTAVVTLCGLCSDASACGFWRRRVCRPRPCVYYYYPVYQYPVYQQPIDPSVQPNLVQLQPLPRLPEVYFPSEEP
jgi:hypothetical protein